MQALDMVNYLASSGTIGRTRVKDVKTALNKLADATHVSVDALDLGRLEATYRQTLTDFFAEIKPTPSQHTVRNTYQNLAQLYRQAHAASLLKPPVGALTRHRIYRRLLFKEMRTTSPYHTHRGGKAGTRYSVPASQWPSEIREGWQAYATVKSIHIRRVTLKGHEYVFSGYMGYLLTQGGGVDRWTQVFEASRLLRYVAFLADRVGVERISASGREIVIVLVDIAKHLERPEYAALQKLKRELPKPAKVYDKKLPRHTVSLIDLDHVGLTLMDDARHPWKFTRETNGSRRAATFATGLAIRLLVRCPRRAREIIEMDLGGRLAQDDRGTWQLHYRSDQLKIAEHDGHPNEFRLPWPPDLVEDLLEYLRDYRPRLLGDSTSSLVFLTIYGGPLDNRVLHQRIGLACYERLNKHVYPHLFRTLWCDAYLDAHPGDWEGAAAMLNDRPETVQRWYRQFRVEQQLKKAIDFNAQLFGRSNSKGTTP